MIITRTPHRISLFGGSCDYSTYYERHGALLVGFTIDKYIYVSLRKNLEIFDYKSRATYSIIEDVKENSKIQNPGIRGTLNHFNIHEGVSIGIQGDMPARTGLGSSSSLVVGLSRAICEMKSEHGVVSKEWLAKHAIEIERVLLAEPGGIQDQIWAAYGGINSISIDVTGKFIVRPLPVSEEFLAKFKDRIVLCHTGFSRNSFEIAASHDNKEASSIKKQIHNTAEYGLVAFENENIDDIGQLLHRSWLLKKSVSTGISAPYIDSLYQKAIENGAIGGKLLGAGGSGFLFFVLKSGVDKADFCGRIGLTGIDFDYSRTGSETLLR